MIRVGKGSPALFFVPSHNDMGHFFPSYYGTTSYFYMNLDDYLDKKEFEDFDMEPNLTPEEVSVVLEYAQKGAVPHPFVSPWYYQMNSLIKKAGGSQLWQFNAIDENLSDRIRQAVILGQKSLIRWSWIDANIKLPILRFLAKILNYLHRNKVEQEILDWEERRKEGLNALV